jgi:hypothetical protein
VVVLVVAVAAVRLPPVLVELETRLQLFHRKEATVVLV